MRMRAYSLDPNSYLIAYAKQREWNISLPGNKKRHLTAATRYIIADFVECEESVGARSGHLELRRGKNIQPGLPLTGGFIFFTVTLYSCV